MYFHVSVHVLDSETYPPAGVTRGGEMTETATPDTALSHADLFDPASAPDFVRILQDIRENEEMFFFEGAKYQAWVVSRHDHVIELLRDDRLIQPSLLPRISSFPEEQKKQLHWCQNLFMKQIFMFLLLPCKAR